MVDKANLKLNSNNNNNNNTIKKSPASEILKTMSPQANNVPIQSQQQQPAQSQQSIIGDGGDNVLRRNDRGCKSSDFYKWPDQPLDMMDSTLSTQQYIQQAIRRNPSDVEAILRLPDGQDLGAWKMEHLRQFCMQLNGLAVKLQAVCHPDTCNQMTATEQWIFLCAAHRQPNECPAIDYTRHTLDGASCLLNSNRYFPSRVTIKDSSVAKLGSVCRRVYRIFSHAFYHHRAAFDEFESETFLCKRFTAFVTTYNLMANETLIVPIGNTAASAAAATTSNIPSNIENLPLESNDPAKIQSSIVDPAIDPNPDDSILIKSYFSANVSSNFLSGKKNTSSTVTGTVTATNPVPTAEDTPAPTAISAIDVSKTAEKDLQLANENIESESS